MNPGRLTLLVLVLLALVVAGCAAPAAPVAPTDTPDAQPVPATVAPTATPQPPASTAAGEPAPYAAPDEQPSPTPPPDEPAYPDPIEPADNETTAWAPDGVVSSGEYDARATFGQMTLHWSNDAEYLYFALEAPTSGWVGIGFDPDNRMQGANFILGAMVDGIARVTDAYGVSPTGATHPPDVELGGTDDIIASGGSLRDGVTIIEAQIPLDSGDDYDKPLTPGDTVTVILAMGSSSEYNAPHTFRTTGEITLSPAS
jgi:hypothetical protein